MLVPALIFTTLAAAGVAFCQSAGAELFEKKIRPIFAAKCHACHGPAQRMAGLDLTSFAGFSKGAASGPLTEGSDPGQSRLVRAISYQGQIKMPPTGKLADEEIASIREWVRMGLPWPGEKSTEEAEEKRFWSFQPYEK